MDKLKNGQFQNVKVDLIKIDIETPTSQIGVLSEGVKLYMKLVTSKRYYALNDRTISLSKKGDVDMGATTSETGEGEPIGEGEPGFSDAELNKNISQQTQVEVFITERIIQEQVDHSFHILILPCLIYINIAF